MRRRDFIKVVGGSIATFPLAARAQQPKQIARIGVLMSAAAEDPEGQSRVVVFRQALQKLGWTEGQNVRIDVHWAAADAALSRPNWSHSRLMSFWPPPARLWRRCNR